MSPKIGVRVAAAVVVVAAVAPAAMEEAARAGGKPAAPAVPGGARLTALRRAQPVRAWSQQARGAARAAAGQQAAYGGVLSMSPLRRPPGRSAAGSALRHHPRPQPPRRPFGRTTAAVEDPGVLAATRAAGAGKAAEAGRTAVPDRRGTGSPEYGVPRSPAPHRFRRPAWAGGSANGSAGGSAGRPPQNTGDVAGWHRLARCESGGRWHLASGNGYYGGLQFTRSTWLAAGGGRYAPRADLASPAEQITVAQRVLHTQGPGAWGACTHRVGTP